MAEKDYRDKHSNTDTDKDFGLPKVDIEPLQTKVETEPVLVDSKDQKPVNTPLAGEPGQEKQETETTGEKKSPTYAGPTKRKEPVKRDRPKKKSNKGGAWIAVILVFILLIAGGVWYWYTYENDTQVEPELATTIERPEEPVAIVEEPEVVEEEIPETFDVTLIRSRAASPRYFVVVGSFIDEDMALDFSARLNRQDKNTYIVYPYGDVAYYRLAIGEYDNLARAVEVLEENQANFKENLWVLKY